MVYMREIVREVWVPWLAMISESGIIYFRQGLSSAVSDR